MRRPVSETRKKHGRYQCRQLQKILDYRKIK